MGARDHTDPTASLSRDPGGLVHVYVEPVPVGTRYRREGPEVGAWLRGSAAERGRGHRRLRSRPREDEQGLGKVSARTRCVRSRAEQAAPSHGTQARCRGWPRLCGSGTRWRRGAKGCSGSRAARGATRTRGLASASDSRASRHVHKSYELLACNAAWREGAAPSSTSSGSGSARRSARVEVPQGTQNKIFGAGRAVLFISDMSPAGEPSSRPRRTRAIKFAYATIFCVA